MQSDAPNASWHPALMPNSIADSPQSRPQDSTPRSAQVEPDDGATAASGQSEEAHSKDSGLDSWFPDDGTGDNWMEGTNNAPAASTEESRQPGPAESAESAGPTEPSTAAKHETRMSFARTVSHEVSWNDDDDAEWELPRTGTDPFKFLPENARTNSFPTASPLEQEAPHKLEQPLPSNEAEELLREIEQEEGSLDATSGTRRGSSSGQVEENGYDSQQYISGGFNGSADDELQARFDEGVPLVSSAEHVPLQESASGEGGDLFGEEAAREEDDFFSNARDTSTSQQHDFQPPTMERKSTMDVLNGLNMGSAGSGFHPLEETAEESEAEGETPQPPETQEPPPENTEHTQDQPRADGENLDEKWKEMFADDDGEDFLPDDGTESKEVDPAAFLGSDDEGLLDDSEAEQPEPQEPTVPPGYPPVPGAQAVNGQHLPLQHTSFGTTPSANPYLPTASAATPTPPNPYQAAVGPAAVAQPPIATPFTVSSSAPPAPARYGYGAPALPQEKTKAQSFVDKAKGGYTSPYDLPMEVVKPKKRATAQPPRNMSAPVPPSAVPPPPRSASLQSHPSPSSVAPGVFRPGSSHSAQAPPTTQKQTNQSFFEELPMTAKARPASRSSHKSQPSPTQPSPYGPPQSAAPPAHPPGLPAQSGPEVGIPQLVAPPRVNPYAALNTNPALAPAAPPAASTRYSPAPPGAPHANGPIPAPASSRYSPAPASRQPSGGYAPAPTVPGPPVLPHQPRTSSPLAHFEISHERSRTHAPNNPAESGSAERRSSSSLYDPRLQRVPSLPPTREVEEEEAPSQAQFSPSRAMPPQPTSPPESKYAPPPQGARQTPPPRLPPSSGQALLSPPKRTMSSHSPLAPPYDFAPPPRSQTQSPGALYGARGAKPADSIPRPSSVHDPTSPSATTYPAPAISSVQAPVAPSMTSSRPRGFSLNLNVIPPTDGREHDPLQRWRGAPLIAWGVGGTFITMFPKEVPRYGMNQSIPAVVRSPGEVKIKNVKDITPLEERLAKFPGPLKGKSKKKETIAWLTTGIESLERALPSSLFVHPQLSHDDKRAMERVLLWKILRLFVEHDGVLEGNPAVDKAVREILTPGLETSEHAVPYMNGVTALGLGDTLTTAVQSDAVGSSTVEQIRRHLLSGDCEKAIWTAVDQRLWGHALLLANALAPNLYKQVTQEFVKKEVNLPGLKNEPLATLYEVLSGNHEESVDELVPVHARAGLQLIAKDAASGPSKDGTEGLDKWSETLGLILSNRSAGDVRAINSLGVLLSGYGRAEAAHICFMFARTHTVFGGLDDPASNFVLVGSDHKRQAEQFAKEIEPLLLSEVYEYGQSLAGGSNVPVTNPHLAAYKLQHAFALAEYGFRDKALQYCDAIAAAITSQTKRSPYHHPILENAVEDLMKRLKQAPKEESNSWISKPSMNKVSDSMWNRFNKFVAGEDNDNSAQGSPGDGETGPLARVAGGTPIVSRSPSTSNLETFGAAVPSYGMPAPVTNPPVAASAPPTRAASRYAPTAAQPAGASSKPYGSPSTYAPRSSMDRTSSELNRGSFELPRRSLDLQSGHAGNHSPVRSGSPAAMYTPYSAGFNSPKDSPYNPVSQQTRPQTSAHQQSVSNTGAHTNGVSSSSGLPAPPPGSQGVQAPGQTPDASGYQPPSYGYEPPSSSPYEVSTEDKNDASDETPNGNSYEPPSYQPYGYEPPSYEPESQPDNSTDSGEESKPKPKKKGIMYDDEDDFPTTKPAEKTKEEKDRENAEMFRKAAEEDAKRAEASKQTKKGWGFTSWFGGGSKKDASQESSPNKPIRAKLGEANSFYYDPELKRWVNKNAGPEDNAKKATPPPPKAAPRSSSSSPAPPSPAAMGSPRLGPEAGRASAPPPRPPRSVSVGGGLGPSSSDSNLGAPPPPGPVNMLRSVSNTSTASAPPPSSSSRPTTSLSNSSSIDDLLGAAGPRRPGGAKKPRKSARYVDVMSKS
ncbi:vesicle coat component [Madurella fahalii]|uniref:Protein transport protein sec16 n=1 Tax=Madurella fahalii TaxID=1157608 RepID=A0ABQ0GAV5_9PEZI